MWGIPGKLVAVAGSLIAGAALLGGVALAQTPTPSAAPGQGQGQQGALGTYFLDQLAKNLNISRSQLDSAAKTAGNSTVDEALRQGKINQDQATRMRDRINQGAGFFGGFGGFGGHSGDRRGPGGPDQRGGNILSAIAGQLKIDPQALMSQLRSGKTLKEIAAAANPPVTDLNTLKPGIKSAVQAELQKNGAPQERIDRALARIDGLDLNQFGQHQGGPGQGGRGHGGPGQGGPRQGN